jgi:hypothetical protein
VALNGIVLFEYTINYPKVWFFPAYNPENKKLCALVGIDVKF